MVCTMPTRPKAKVNHGIGPLKRHMRNIQIFIEKKFKIDTFNLILLEKFCGSYIMLTGKVKSYYKKS